MVHINQVNPREILKEIRHDDKWLLMSKILMPERQRKKERERERERENRKIIEPSDFSTLLSPKVWTGLDLCNFPDHILKVSDQYIYFFQKSWFCFTKRLYK